MADQRRHHPSAHSTPEPSATLRVERLGVTQQFIALKREVETMRGRDNHGGAA
ncbi:MAG: hypothetical protein QOD88_3080 [Mycobacterium sp.]|jgi:hypothetical protein|nr:hypothetical protein [Mycobacterium sp.]